MPLKPASLKRIVADLVLLDDMSTPLILHNLKVRFEKGSVLCSPHPQRFKGHLHEYRNDLDFLQPLSAARIVHTREDL